MHVGKSSETGVTLPGSMDSLSESMRNCHKAAFAERVEPGLALRVGLVGLSGSGKSLAAHYMRLKLGYQEHQIAEPIKDFVREVLGLALSLDPLSNGPRLEPHRRLMQAVSAAAREADEDIFIRALLRRIDCTDPTQKVVVSDVRYPNEAQLLNRAGFLLLRIERLDAEYLGSKLAIATHPSELAQEAIEVHGTLSAKNISSLLYQLPFYLEA